VVEGVWAVITHYTIRQVTSFSVKTCCNETAMKAALGVVPPQLVVRSIVFHGHRSCSHQLQCQRHDYQRITAILPVSPSSSPSGPLMNLRHSARIPQQTPLILPHTAGRTIGNPYPAIAALCTIAKREPAPTMPMCA
jgi:hypothetical protein